VPQGAIPGSSFKYTPLQHLRWLYCRFIQGIFHAAPRGAYHWEPSDDFTEIMVSSENTLDAEKMQMRPGITITRGPIQFVTLGLDDMLGYNSATGQKKKGVLVPGTMSINCCSRNDLESENLAWIIAENLWMNRDMLMQYGFFEVGRSPVISAPTPAGTLVSNDNGKEWYATSVTCPFQFYRTGQITPLGQEILNGISMRLGTGFEGVPQQGVPSGYAVEGQRPPPYSNASDADGNSPNAGAEQAALPRVPNPMNPAQTVTVRTVRPGQQGVRAPSIYGRLLPITTPSVEESPSSVELESTVKV
jgi:hypothetical protein